MCSLKLVEEENGDSLPFDRRVDIRRRIRGSVTALQTHDNVKDPRWHICSLKLLNISGSGLGAMVREPLEIDSHVSVYFPPHGPEQPIRYEGRVVRCSARDEGSEIGVRFEPRTAACA